MTTHRKFNIFLAFLLFFELSLLFRATNVFSATASHVVISEIQIAGGNSNDEFVELYNPTNASVNLTGWRLNFR